MTGRISKERVNGDGNVDGADIQIFEDNFAIPKAIYSVITSYITWIVIGAIALIVGLVLFFRSTAGKVTIEFIKAKKRKVCPLITFEEKQKE